MQVATRGRMGPEMIIKAADMIRSYAPSSSTTGFGFRARQTPKMLAGIDLFVGRCIEGGQ
ncbi:hypothetical protein [Bradyrhizobium sp.]|uniref:hypothetical protein n=1 Tax=Bradyrhizobium sp. TaxID=376 RepID=UPI0025BB3043|nr:hypothetical protein [Bradyrhizobium sp.]